VAGRGLLREPHGERCTSPEKIVHHLRCNVCFFFRQQTAKECTPADQRLGAVDAREGLRRLVGGRLLTVQMDCGWTTACAQEGAHCFHSAYQDRTHCADWTIEAGHVIQPERASAACAQLKQVSDRECCQAAAMLDDHADV
jgi:hypothetical protein